MRAHAPAADRATDAAAADLAPAAAAIAGVPLELPGPGLRGLRR